MEIANRETYGLLAVVLLLLIRQYPVDLRLRFLQSLQMLYLFYRTHRLQVARRPRRAWVFPRPQNWFQELLNNRALDHWWKENFRVSRATFEFICRLVGPAIVRLNTRLRDAVAVKKRVAVSLWRLATGECYRSCGLMIGLAKPTVVKCCHEFVEAICRLQDDFIKFPSTRAEIGRKIEDFSEKCTFPNVVAAIDGSHIPIKAPKENHEDYFNRKHFYSYLVQGIVDSSGIFLSVATGFPGSLHDSRMLRLSDVYGTYPGFGRNRNSPPCCGRLSISIKDLASTSYQR